VKMQNAITQNASQIFMLMGKVSKKLMLLKTYSFSPSEQVNATNELINTQKQIPARIKKNKNLNKNFRTHCKKSRRYTKNPFNPFHQYLQNRLKLIRSPIQIRFTSFQTPIQIPAIHRQIPLKKLIHHERIVKSHQPFSSSVSGKLSISFPAKISSGSQRSFTRAIRFF
jgi:hypothetical protein